MPRFGSCVGKGNYCEPCRNDVDCGDKTGKLTCSRLESGGERSCVDPSLSTDCTTDTDCPTGPDGRHGTCIGPNEEASVGDPTYHKCYVPFTVATDRYSCWCQNLGTACQTGKDCCSKKCGPISQITGTGVCLAAP